MFKCSVLIKIRAFCSPPADCASCEPEPHGGFFAIEAITALIFTAEYVGRAAAATRMRHELVDSYRLIELITHAFRGASDSERRGMRVR